MPFPNTVSLFQIAYSRFGASCRLETTTSPMGKDRSPESQHNVWRHHIFACGALAASISVGIVIPSTCFVYLYKQTVSITVVVMGTKQFNNKTTHRQQLKTGFVQKWEMGKQKSRTFPGLFQDFFIFQGLNFFPIL